MPTRADPSLSPRLAGVRLAAACVAASSLGGCASMLYERTQPATISGKLYVEWIEPNQFIYRPDKDDPLTFKGADGTVIQPQLMYTDGGSIPRLFWSAPGLGPWDFGPGYVVHDWLFTQHHCHVGDWQKFDLHVSANILAEAMKAQMVESGQSEPTLLWAVYEAVQTPVAQKLWDEGACKLPQPAQLSEQAITAGLPAPAPVRILTIDANPTAKSKPGM